MKWGIVSSDRCTFCLNERETIVQLFWECSIVQRVWHDFKEYVTNELTSSINFELSKTNVIFNTLVPDPKHVLNTCVLIIKQYIYRCKSQSLKPTWAQIAGQIDYIEVLEFYNALCQGRTSKHIKKWSLINLRNENNEGISDNFIHDYLNML